MLNQPKYPYNNQPNPNPGIRDYFRQLTGWKMSYRLTKDGLIMGVFMPEKGEKELNNGKKEN